MTSSDIDDAVLAVAQPSWKKVAMIIVQAAEKLGDQVPDRDPGYQSIACRIEALVREGRLVAQGDVTMWRHCEIRLPAHT